MLLKHQKIINKIRFLLKIEAMAELEDPKYVRYLQHDFSCRYCKYNLSKSKKNSIVSCKMYSNSKTRLGNGLYWCFKWVEPGKWFYTKEKNKSRKLDKTIKV